MTTTTVTVVVEFTRSAGNSVSYRRLSIAASNGVEMDDLVDANQMVAGFSNAFTTWRSAQVKEVSKLRLGRQRTETFTYTGEVTS